MKKIIYTGLVRSLNPAEKLQKDISYKLVRKTPNVDKNTTKIGSCVHLPSSYSVRHFASKSGKDGKNKGDKMISQKAEPGTGEDGKGGAGAGNEKSPFNPHQGTAERADQMDIERFEHEGGPPRRTDRAAASAEQLALEGFENEAGVSWRGERGMSQYSAMHQNEILAGELDHIPEAAFYMVGTIEDVIAKSLQLAK